MTRSPSRPAWLLILLELLVGIMLGAAVGAAEAPPAAAGKTVYMVLWRGETEAEKGFRDYLTGHDRMRAEDFIVRDCAGDKSKLPGIIAEIRTRRPDLIYAFGTTVTLALAGTYDAAPVGDNIPGIPIVFCVVAKPFDPELRLAKTPLSGRNLTGVSHLVPLGIQLKVLKETFPLRVLGVIYNPAEQNSVAQVGELVAEEIRMGYRLIKEPFPLDSGGRPDLTKLDVMAGELAAAGANVVYLPSDSFVNANAAVIVEALHSRQLPTFSVTEGPIRQGGALLGVISRYSTVGEFAAYKAEQILFEGKKAAEIPIEALSRHSLIVNLSAVKRLHTYPPLSILRLAELIDTPALSRP